MKIGISSSGATVVSMRLLGQIKARHRKDAGAWVLDEKSGKWIEDEFDSKEFHDLYPLKRDASSNTKAVFYVGGFPRQGNSVLRLALLETFPDMAMPDSLKHVVSLAEKAILAEKIVFLTIRNPHDAISSLVGMNKESLMVDDIFEKNKKKYRFRVDEYINFYIRYCLFIKDNYKKITVIPFEKIIQITDDFNNGNIKNNQTIKHVADKHNLSIYQPLNSKIVVFSTANKELELLYSDTSYYRKRIKKANKLYKQIIELTARSGV